MEKIGGGEPEPNAGPRRARPGHRAWRRRPHPRARHAGFRCRAKAATWTSARARRATSRSFPHIETIEGRISGEQILCGRGLVNIYRAVAIADGKAPTLHRCRPRSPLPHSPARDAVAEEALALFVTCLGRTAGDLALVFMSRAASFSPAASPRRSCRRCKAGNFRAAFEDKAPHSELMRSMPIYVITHPLAALAGLAAYARTPVAVRRRDEGTALARNRTAPGSKAQTCQTARRCTIERAIASGGAGRQAAAGRLRFESNRPSTIAAVSARRDLRGPQAHRRRKRARTFVWHMPVRHRLPCRRSPRTTAFTAWIMTRCHRRDLRPTGAPTSSPDLRARSSPLSCLRGIATYGQAVIAGQDRQQHRRALPAPALRHLMTLERRFLQRDALRPARRADQRERQRHPRRPQHDRDLGRPRRR